MLRAGRPSFLTPLFLLLTLVLIVSFLAPDTAEAHANYVDSDPAPNSVLETPPERVTIRFTEPLVPSLSEIRVLDSRGLRVDNADSAPYSSGGTVNPETMSVTVKPLADGTYTVVWKNVSTVDGHRMRGSFVFSVGGPISADDTLLVSEQPLLQAWVEPVLRWLTLLSGLTLLGGLVFLIAVLRPAMSAESVRDLDRVAGVEQSDVRDVRELLQLGNMLVCVIALFVFMLASLAQGIHQASLIYETSILEAAVNSVVSMPLETGWGRLWAIRLALIFVASVSFALLRNRDEDGVRVWPLVLTTVAATGALLTISLSSHAAATPGVRTAAVLNDFVHLIAASVWVGGLAAFASIAPYTLLYMRGLPYAPIMRATLAALAHRFSPVAALSVAVLAVTGLYSAWAQVTTFAALATPYGIALVAKVALVVLLLAIAAVNLLWVRPRLRSQASAAGQVESGVNGTVAASRPYPLSSDEGYDHSAALWLTRLLKAEYVVVVLVIVAVGFLTTLEPARQVASREGIGVQSRLSFEEVSEGARMTLEIDPGHVGPNTVRVSLRDASDDPITNATDVRVRLSYLDDDLGETAYSATETGEGEFALDEHLISIAGAWQVDLIVQRPDAFDARAAFRFEVSDRSGGSLAIAPEPDTGRALLGIELLLLGFVFMGVSIPIGGWFSRRGAATMLVGAVVVVIGGALLFGALGAGNDLPERNPIPPTQESVAAGMLLYQESCQLCHGSTGMGDGPGGAGLNPPPADLTVHVPLHPDRDLFEFIAEGVPGTAMAPLGDKLSEDEIWHLVNYIQTLQ